MLYMKRLTLGVSSRSLIPSTHKTRGGRLILTSFSWSLSLLSLLCVLSGCSSDDTLSVNARRVQTRADLVGGPSALGELGDVVMENNRVKVVIQDKGFSRGFGVYGGGLIDADLVRPVAPGNSDGVIGRDSFGELFPIFFLQALQPQTVEILPLSPEGEAQVRVSGEGGDFLSITKILNRVLVNAYEGLEGFTNILEVATALGDEMQKAMLISDQPQVSFEILYRLRPNVAYMIIESAMINLTDEAIPLPSQVADLLFNFPLLKGIARDPFRVPLGFITLFGAGNKIFAPGYGFDIRFPLEDRYALSAEATRERDDAEASGTPLTPEQDKTLALPALPGLITSGLISVNPEGCSYGLFYIPEPIVEEGGETAYPKSFAYNLLDYAEGDAQRNVFEKAFGDIVTPGDSLIPFSASSFTGMFSSQAPPQLDPQQRFSTQHAFIIGDGDVSSVMDTYYEMRGVDVETVVGEVLDEVTGAPVSSASVIIYDTNDRIINQSYTNERGQLRLMLPVGSYQARVEHGPTISPKSSFVVRSGNGGTLRLARLSPARIHVEIRGEDQRALPAKVTVVGTARAAQSGLPLREHLFDLSAGQSWRVSDLVPDDPERPETRRYIETSGYTKDGKVSLEVPPGDYLVYLSRGSEFELKYISDIRLSAGGEVSIRETLKREIQTPGYISADFHLHAAPSLDSDTSIRQRVRTAAGEGLEHLVATDHNFVTDYQPAIEREGLTDWLSSMVGLELTTLESGHFNTFPIKRDVSAITRGAFQWSTRPPQSLFDEARSIGAEIDAEGAPTTIIQVNHPRDLILGYFSQYDINPLTGRVTEAPPGGGSILDVAGQLLAASGEAFFNEEGDSQYSDDFDVIEVLNHGLFHEEFHARMPENIGDANIYNASGDPLTPQEIAEIPVGSILCDGGEVAYAGAIDDWFNLLNLGRRVGGTANSDSHDRDDIGYPRTYVHVGTDDPAEVTPQAVAKAVRQGKMTMSRGPFLEMFVNDQPIGSELIVPEGEVTVKVKVQAARWIEVNRGVLYANGAPIETFKVDLSDPAVRLFEWSTTLTLDRDTWFVAQVSGDVSMFPVAPPIDLPPVLLNEAFGTIAGPLGFGGSAIDEVAPSQTGTFKPLALSNPTWVDLDGEGFDPPGVTAQICEGFFVIPDPTIGTEERSSPLILDGSPTAKSERRPRQSSSDLSPEVLEPDDALQLKSLSERHRLNRRDLTRSFGFPRLKRDLSDIRVIFEHFGSHGHGAH